MHKIRRKTPELLLTSAALAVAMPASATTMRRASIEELAAESELVVLGTVRAATPIEAPRGGIYTRVELDVEETWRGPASSSATFLVHGGRLGARAMRTHGQATFAPGERVLVFLDDAGGALFPTGMSQGKWVVEGSHARSAADAGSLVIPRDGRLVPAAPLPAIALDALRARVRSMR